MSWKADYLIQVGRLVKHGFYYGPFPIVTSKGVIGFGWEVDLSCRVYKKVRLTKHGLRLCGKDIANRILALNKRGIHVTLKLPFDGITQLKYEINGKRKVLRFNFKRIIQKESVNEKVEKASRKRGKETKVQIKGRNKKEAKATNGRSHGKAEKGKRKKGKGKGQ